MGDSVVSVRSNAVLMRLALRLRRPEESQPRAERASNDAHFGQCSRCSVAQCSKRQLRPK